MRISDVGRDTRTQQPKAPVRPVIGQHVASLNLFLEPDGKFYITVASTSSGTDINSFIPELGKNPMQALATMIADAGPRFVENWAKWERGK